jgi:2-haloacid dehalogenase
MNTSGDRWACQSARSRGNIESLNEFGGRRQSRPRQNSGVGHVPNILCGTIPSSSATVTMNGGPSRTPCRPELVFVDDRASRSLGRRFGKSASGRDDSALALARLVSHISEGMGEAMATVLVLDVNETLLDLSALDPLFDDALGDASLRPQWFATMLQLAFVGGLTGHYVDFTTAQRAALQMTAARAGRTVSDEVVDHVVGAMRRLPPHRDVRPALIALRDEGFRLTALTNSVLDVARAQLSYARLDDIVKKIFSADEVGALKPAPQPYRMVADRLGVDTTDLCLVAAHPWDVSGALAAGCQGAFVARQPGMVPSPLGAQPTVIGADLIEVAQKLAAIRHQRDEN